MHFGAQHTKCNFIFPFPAPPGFKWHEQSGGLIGSVCRSLAHLHVLPRIVSHGIFAWVVNISKTETLSGEAGSQGGKTDCSSQAVLTRLVLFQSVFDPIKITDDHWCSPSVNQPKLGWVGCGVIYNSQVLFLDSCPEASCHLLFGQCLLERIFCNYFHAFSQEHLLSNGDIQEKNAEVVNTESDGIRVLKMGSDKRQGRTLMILPILYLEIYSST